MYSHIYVYASHVSWKSQYFDTQMPIYHTQSTCDDQTEQ